MKLEPLMAQGPVDVDVRGDLCAICGRPPHVCDDPECVPASAPLAEKVRFLVAQNARYRAALETMTKCEPCDCGCPGGQKPVLMKPQHYYAIAREALGVGIDESRDVAGTGSAHCPMTKAANSDADCVCCDSVPTPNGGGQAPCAASCARSPGTKC